MNYLSQSLGNLLSRHDYHHFVNKKTEANLFKYLLLITIYSDYILTIKLVYLSDIVNIIILQSLLELQRSLCLKLLLTFINI